MPTSDQTLKAIAKTDVSGCLSPKLRSKRSRDSLEKPYQVFPGNPKTALMEENPTKSHGGISSKASIRFKTPSPLGATSDFGLAESGIFHPTGFV
jgi:hypothetical protein